MKRLLILLLLVASFAHAEDVGPIQAMPQGTATISCTNASAATALPRADQQFRRQVELSNAGTSTIFLEFGPSTVAAVVASGYPILAGQTKVVSVSPATTHIACITASATVTLYATVGIGQ